jgi:alpha-L-fucosidase 2
MKELIILLSVLVSLPAIAGKEYKLWYKQPAATWTEALPLGNGRLGAMVFGNPLVERLQLNEETIWSGQPNNNANPEAKKYLPKVRQLVFDGKYEEAQTMATQHVMANTNSGMAYEPFGDLYISFQNHDNYTNYYRELSLDSARSITRYTIGDVTYQREYITSFTDQVITVHLTANKRGCITCNAMMTSPQQDVNVMSKNDEIVLSGISGSLEGMKGKIQFTGRATARSIGGKTESRNGVLSINGADEATIYISIATNFKHYNDITGNDTIRSEEYLKKALTNDYQRMKSKHVTFYKRLMDRVNLDLGEDKFPDIETDERVDKFRQNNDLYLAATYFRFGRYLLICSSQPGCQPPTLQGIWNDKMLPSWDSKYTTNINLEMNYWPAESTNLSELTEPLFSFIKDISETGHQTASIMYGADGWVLHHNSDIWRITGAVDKATSGLWPTGGAWVCQHLWEHYLFSGDISFLKKAYLIMTGAARFLNQIMIKEPKHGWWVICPSLSPENTHAGANGKATTAAGVTMDNELVRDLFSHVITASRLLKDKNGLADSLKEKLADMPPLQTGRWGQLQEWMDDWDNANDIHRHVSHLYSLYPSCQITPYRNETLTDAARTSLIHRGDPSTGWSIGWKVCLWARLLDGDHAWKLIGDQLTLVRNEKKKGGTYPNLFDAHPPFQIDGNFGCTAGIAEMLLQSHDNFVYLLPALPNIWKNGSITGLRARGGFTIDMTWKNNHIEKTVIKSAIGGVCRIRSDVPLSGKGLKEAKGENKNPLFQSVETPQQINYPDKIEKNTTLRKTYLYDIKTKAGNVYILYKK